MLIIVVYVVVVVVVVVLVDVVFVAVVPIANLHISLPYPSLSSNNERNGTVRNRYGIFASWHGRTIQVSVTVPDRNCTIRGTLRRGTFHVHFL